MISDNCTFAQCSNFSFRPMAQKKKILQKIFKYLSSVAVKNATAFAHNSQATGDCFITVFCNIYLVHSHDTLKIVVVEK